MPSQKLDESAKGVYAIAATPFDDRGALDFASVGSLVDFYLRHRVTGLTVLGMMGEAPKLSSSESADVLAAFFDAVAGRVPVIVGVSAPGTKSLVSFSHHAMAAGAAAVMVAPIAGLKTDDQIYQYFDEVLRALGPDVPVVLQDFPPATTVFMSATLIGRLTQDFRQIVMLKHEDAPGLNKLSRVRRDAQAGGHRRVSITVGNGGVYLPQELARGADGAMTGFAYPEMLVRVCEHFANGDPQAGEDLFNCYLPLVRHEAQPGVGIALRKEVLRRRNAIKSAHVRQPGPSLTKDDHSDLTSLIARLERDLAKLGLIG